MIHILIRENEETTIYRTKKSAIQMAKYLIDTKKESFVSVYKGKWCGDLLITEANSGIHFHAK